MLVSRWTLVVLAAAACGDNRSAPDAAVPVDAASPDAPPDADPLGTLAGTGLCADPGCTQINAGIREYAPRIQFWDDGAEKRRWLYLPAGTQIITADMDYWKFPVGTKVWKEFKRDGTRVETRLLMKLLEDDNAPGAWYFAAYQWNGSQDAALQVTAGVQNANGTQHDIPKRTECRDCHDRLSSRVLGFQAIQLDHDAPAGLLDLEDLVAEGLLTTVPADQPPAGAPRFPLPGTAVEVAALDYLNGNCGHCHNPTSELYQGHTMVDLRLRTAMLGTPAETPTYTSTINKLASVPYTENGTRYTIIVIPDDPTMSSLISRMSSMQAERFMPNVAVESIDPLGQTVLVDWINSL